MFRKVASVGVLVILIVLSMSVSASNGLIGQTEATLTGNQTVTFISPSGVALPPDGQTEAPPQEDDGAGDQ